MMSRAHFEAVVDRALEGLPGWVIERLDNVVVVVEDRPTPEQDPDGEGILGIYEGISLLERSGDYWGAMPDQVTVFRVPHLHLGLGEDDLEEEIRRTVLHELAHHLGIDDARLRELGWD
jgi:predicted Zn-dependent protease with MMP-like domain